VVVQAERRFGKLSFASISAPSGLGGVNSNKTYIKPGRKCTHLYSSWLVFVPRFSVDRSPLPGVALPSVPPPSGVTLRQSPMFVMHTIKGKARYCRFRRRRPHGSPGTLKDAEKSTAVENLASFVHVREPRHDQRECDRHPLPFPKPRHFPVRLSSAVVLIGVSS
jgi:hypothetical protein